MTLTRLDSLRKAQESADEPQGRRRQRRSKTTGLDRFFVDEAELSGSASSDEEVGGVDADEDEEVLSGDFIDNRASALTQRTPPTPSFYRAVAMREEEEAQCGEGLGEEKDLFFLVNGRTRRSRAVVDTPDRPEDCWPDSAVRAIAPAAPAASWASHRPPRPPTAAPRRLGANHSSAPTSFRALLSSRSTPTDDDDEFLL